MTTATDSKRQTRHVPLVRRTYSLRLRNGLDGDDESWRDHIWKTHEAVNRGAKAFGDWLLTLRGGLTHELAQGPSELNGNESRDGIAEEGKERRVLLALCWLSVESAEGAPQQYVVPHEMDLIRGRRIKWDTSGAFREILETRGLSSKEIESWLSDCSPSLAAAIREDAVWVNRARAFSDRMKHLGFAISQDDISDFVGRFLGSPKQYLQSSDVNTVERGEKVFKDLTQEASRWLSNRFGRGRGTDFERLAMLYEKIGCWAGRAENGLSGRATVERLSEALAELKPTQSGLSGILELLAGHRSTTRNVLKEIASLTKVAATDVSNLRETVELDGEKCRSKIGAKGERAYATAILRDVEALCGFAYAPQGSRSRHEFYTAILDVAGQRFSAAHSLVRRADRERRRFQKDAESIAPVPEVASNWLDRFCVERSSDLGTLEPFRISTRAVDGWKEIVESWSDPECRSEADRVRAVRMLQADANGGRFGDHQLFEALAREDARCTWTRAGEPDAAILEDYVAVRDAEAKTLSLKVPCYRHPDSLRHPVSCNFGNGRCEILFDIHEATKKKRFLKKASHRPYHPQGVTLELWDGTAIRRAKLRWSSKRLRSDLNLLGMAKGCGKIAVSRSNRLGRAAAGVGERTCVNVMEVFRAEKWNGRLHVPRHELRKLRECVEASGGRWSVDAIKLRRHLNWSIGFMPRLRPTGPWIEFAERQQIIARPHAEENEKRQGASKFTLARLPGVRILSVNPSKRYAAACALWEAVSAEQVTASCRRLGIAPPGAQSMFLHLQAEGRSGRSVYRRIAGDTLPDGREHPAPWARLDRQFFIKLPGEDRDHDVRKAGRAEIESVDKLEYELGFARRWPRKPTELAVDLLMADAIEVMHGGLRRHGDCARIAFGFIGSTALPPGKGDERRSASEGIEPIVHALGLWKRHFSDPHWHGDWARRNWEEYISPRFCNLSSRDTPANVNNSGTEAVAATNSSRLGDLAAMLCEEASILTQLHCLWADRWRRDDEAWRMRLRWMSDWLRPRGLRADKHAKMQCLSVGGLSPTRVATLEAFYRLQNAWAKRPEPDDPRKNIADAGQSFSSRILTTIRNLRQNRMKQLASRIVEAALGVGIEHRGPTKKEPKRPRQRVTNARFAPCHAVVLGIPGGGRLADKGERENRTKISTLSARETKSLLTESCRLHGLYLCEVSAQHTFDQDSRTGAPGVRCADIPIHDFLNQAPWAKIVRQSAERQQRGMSRRWDDYVISLHRFWSEHANGDRSGRTVRIPLSAGPIFLSASDELAGVGGIDGELNAAANVGLRALRDPDWPGSWWYIPCYEATKLPIKERVFGSMAVDCSSPLGVYVTRAVPSHGPATRNAPLQANAKIVNLWRDPSGLPINGDSTWRTFDEYWSRVQENALDHLTRAYVER